jgi:hypothetical protein
MSAAQSGTIMVSLLIRALAVELFPSRSNLHHAITASWFETRGVAALLTTRFF